MYELTAPQKATETYWGSIQTLVDTPEYSAKRIWMRAGCQSSLEYHVHKKETYLIEEGLLIVGLRERRAINTEVALKIGDVFTIFPGQMHMRIAVTDVQILEVSTHDEACDTYFVEDGKTYKHKGDK